MARWANDHDIGSLAPAQGEATGGSGGVRLRAALSNYVKRLVEGLGACAALLEVSALHLTPRTGEGCQTL